MLSLRIRRFASDLYLSKMNLTLDWTGSNARLILEENFLFCRNTERHKQKRREFSLRARAPSESKTRLDWKDLLYLVVATAIRSFWFHAISR